MTNHWIDIKNSDCILVMGANPAENHPISFKYVMQAKDNGAKLICVDPRFTRTAAVADIYAPLRSGTDIAFLGGMIKYILENGLFQRTYLTNYTNAPFIVNEKYSFDDGLFAGFDPENKRYDTKLWAFEMDAGGIPKKDPTLRHKRSVFQLLRKHFARYDLKTVSKITGTSEDRIWINDGGGIFSDCEQDLSTGFSSGIGLGDLDGDGDLDAFIAHGQLGLSEGGGLPNEVWWNESP